MQFSLLQVVALAVFSFSGTEALAQTNHTVPVRTSFFRGPALTAQEIELVVELARQCGLAQPELIADVRILPNLKSVPRSLIVTSTERVEGRKASRYFVRVEGTNWTPASLSSAAKRLAKFYVNPPYIHTNELALVQFGTNSARMTLAKDIPLPLADAMVGRFARREVRFRSPELERDWAVVEVSDPTALSKDTGTNGYRICFGSPARQEIAFNFINDQVVITHVPGQIVY